MIYTYKRPRSFKVIQMLLVFLFLVKGKALLDSLGQKWPPPLLINVKNESKTTIAQH